VNVTPPISATGPVHSTSPAQPANSSLADFLFADSSAGSPSDFRTIAAALFGAEGSTATSAQSPAKSIVAGKKAAADTLEEKSGTRKETSDPALPRLHPDLIVPPQNVPAPLIQVPQQGESTNGTLAAQGRSPVKDDLARSVFSASSQPAQISSEEPDTLVVRLDERLSPSGSSENGVPLVQLHAANNDLKEQKQPATSATSLQTNGSTRKKDVESAKPDADRSQPPVDPRPENQSAPATTNTNQTTQTIVPHVGISTEKPLGSATTDDAPQSQPVEPTSDATQVLDSVAATKDLPQPELANPGAVTESRGASRRNSLGTSAKTKGRDSKDSRVPPAQSGKPGFIQTNQILSGSPNATGSGKDSPGLPSPGHPGAHAKQAALKASADAPSSPSLTDADGPDETLPTSASSPVTARLVQGMSQSEFRVGMQSQEFGNIDIRTSVARHMFSAQISVEHSDVAKSLTAQLPGLYHRLADQQVAVGNIVIHGQSLETSSGLAHDAQRESWQPQGHSAVKSNAEPILPLATEGIDSAGRLDIRI
jgi:hypothetical protein